MLAFVVFVVIFVVLVHALYWFGPSRLFVVSFMLRSNLESIFTEVGRLLSLVFLSLMYFLVISNFLGNLPFSSSFTMYYFFTASLSLSLWVPLMVVVGRTQLKPFLAHMMPYGAPMFLGVLLPVVEIFSQFIRPLTLMVRLSTNLSSGHIMLFMFSFFSTSSLLISSFIMLLLVMLFILEVVISLLQAYIFSSLFFMYLKETL